MWVTVIAVLSAILLPPAVLAQQEDVAQLAGQIAGKSGGSIERARKLLTWINTEFQWTATDYQKRTAEEIIRRRGGNCAELARVLEALLKPAGIRYRWVAEINIHPYTPRRQETAAKMVAEKGNRYSVFGLRHNDHRWLEIYDDAAQAWVPADPSVGVIGVRDWLAARMALSNRLQPAVPAVASIVGEMIVPFAIVVTDGGSVREGRSQFYLIDQFDAFYGGKLAALPAWPEWTRLVRELSPAAAGAFEGKLNLHGSGGRIAQLANTYEALQRQAAEKNITPAW